VDVKEQMAIQFLAAIISNEGAAHPDATYTKESGTTYKGVIKTDCERAILYANTLCEMLK